MSKKTLFLSLMALSLSIGLASSLGSVNAVDFDGQENKYIQLCSSSKLSKNQQKTCKEFNTYLNKKNKELSAQAKNAKKDAQESKDSIENLAKQITDIETKISSTESELNYIQKSIANIEKQISNKRKQLEDRLYSMQTTMNSNIFTSYIFGADSFSDFFSRIINFKEITNYENELIDDLNESMKEIQKQESTLKILKNSLEDDKKSQANLQKTFQAKLLEQNKTIADNSSEVSKNQESMEKIQANLAALQKASNESKVSNVTQATTDKKPKPKPNTDTNQSTKPDTTKPNTNTDTSKPNTDTTKPDTNNSNQSTSQDNSNDLSANEELGLKIANKALTRQGYMYVWGGAHSWSSIKNPNWTQFDCSGLVNWVHYQSGVNLGRIHYTGSLINAGKSVSKNNLQAGDIILFSSNGSSSGVHHVGIYIGGNKMVHAPTTGQPVQVANLNTNYWQREWYTCRRLY